MRRWLIEGLKGWVYRSELLAPVSAPSYRYCLKVSELCALAEAISATLGSNGRVVEIGVARGMTTVFLNTHMDALRDGRSYLAIDTFAGFTSADVDYEVSRRGKTRAHYFGFTYNDEKIFRRNMARLGFDRVQTLKLDANHLSGEHLGGVSVALLDVDLYRPTLHALDVLYEALEEGGYIFVHDVSAGGVYDGASQAYHEFTARMDLPPTLVGDNCGLIRKQLVTAR